MRALWSDRQNCSHNVSQKVKRIRRLSEQRTQGLHGPISLCFGEIWPPTKASLETGIGGVKSPKIRGGVKISNFQGPLKFTPFYRDSIENRQFGGQNSKSSRGNFRGEFPPPLAFGTFWPPYPGVRLVIRIAAITLTSNSAVAIARFCPSKDLFFKLTRSRRKGRQDPSQQACAVVWPLLPAAHRPTPWQPISPSLRGCTLTPLIKGGVGPKNTIKQVVLDTRPP